jgi:hypothetical protein
VSPRAVVVEAVRDALRLEADALRMASRGMRHEHLIVAHEAADAWRELERLVREMPRGLPN